MLCYQVLLRWIEFGQPQSDATQWYSYLKFADKMCLCAYTNKDEMWHNDTHAAWPTSAIYLCKIIIIIIIIIKTNKIK